MKLVSIIVPIYKVKENYFKQCIESLIHQTYQNLEIILIDDGSFDRCSTLCDEYAILDSRIRIIHKQNEGVSVARNKGIEISKGDFVCFVDADDYIESNYIEDMLQNINDADVVCSGHTKVFFHKYEKHGAFCPKFQYNMDVIGTVWGKLYRRELIGKEKFDRSLSHCEDIEFNFRIFKNAKYKYNPSYGYYYRYVNNSTVHQFQDDMINKYLLTIKKIHGMNLDSSQKIAYDIFVCTIFRVIVENYIYYKKESFLKKINDIKILANSQYFKESINNVDLDRLSKTRGFPIYCVKKRKYVMIYIVIFVRKMQYKVYNKER